MFVRLVAVVDDLELIVDGRDALELFDRVDNRLMLVLAVDMTGNRDFAVYCRQRKMFPFDLV